MIIAYAIVFVVVVVPCLLHTVFSRRLKCYQNECCCFHLLRPFSSFQGAGGLKATPLRVFKCFFVADQEGPSLCE